MHCAGVHKMQSVHEGAAPRESCHVHVAGAGSWVGMAMFVTSPSAAVAMMIVGRSKKTPKSRDFHAADLLHTVFWRTYQLHMLMFARCLPL